MKKSLVALLVAILVPLVSVQTAAADQSKGKNSVGSWTQLTGTSQIWILGSQVRVYECLAKPTSASLSVKSSGGWVEVANTVAAPDPKLCPRNSAPYAATYEFVLKFDGQQDFPGTHAKLLVYRITYAQGSRQGLSAVYEGSDEMNEDQTDGKLPAASATSEAEQQPSISATPRPTQSKSGASPTPSVIAGDGWNGCSFAGVPMYGRVKVVSVGGQFKIRVVGSKAKLLVKGVTKPAKSCGEWQFVSGTPTFTVEIVRTGEDFTVSFGAKRPGVTK